MDRISLYKLYRLILPKFKSQYKLISSITLLFQAFIVITLSYLGGVRISDLRIIFRSLKSEF